MTREEAERRAWERAGDILLDSPLEDDDWHMERERLALRILETMTRSSGGNDAPHTGGTMTITIQDAAANVRIVFSARGQMLFERGAGVWAFSDFFKHSDAMTDADIVDKVATLEGRGWSVVNVNGTGVSE